MTRTTRELIDRRHNISRIALTGVICTMAFATATVPLQEVRGSDGAVSCLVSVTTDGPQGQHQLAVQVRAPGAPAEEVIASLPPELRDFSTLPIRVVLLSPSSTNAAPLLRLPLSLDPTVEHPVIDGTPSSPGFVRAIFPRDWVVAGATILGERMVVAPDGTKVTSQTRCAITASDAAQWR